MKYLVIDVGGTFTKFALMSENGEIISKDKVATVTDTVENFLQMLFDIYENLSEDVQGIAISSAGMIDRDNGVMFNGGAVTCIKNLNIVEILKNKYNVPVSVENDARSAAFAELWKGSLVNYKNAVAMILGTGVGGAIIIDGKVLKGTNLIAGELSYVLTDFKDHKNLKNTLGFVGGVNTFVSNVIKNKGIDEPLDGEKIFEMALSGDEVALDCIRSYALGLAIQITNLQSTIDQEITTIGGGISSQPLFIDILREELVNVSETFGGRLPLPKITTCKFFNDSNLIGALYVHLEMLNKI